MIEQEQRDAIVHEAQSWIGTPYHPGADIKGVGVDCGMLLVRVFVDAGLVSAFDPRPYPQQWHMHQVAERYMAWVEKFAREIAGPPGPGDIVMLKLPSAKAFGHGGIVVEWPRFIHASPTQGGRNVRQLGPVHEVNMDQEVTMGSWARKYFSIWASVM